jgi:outer membrane protein assembly factor BamB
MRRVSSDLFDLNLALAVISLTVNVMLTVNGHAQTELAAGGEDHPRTSATTLNTELSDYTKQTGYVATSSLTEKPKVIWKFVSERRTASGGRSYMIDVTDPVVADGVVYFADRGAPSRVFALNAVDGKKLWQHQHTSPGIVVEPSLDQDHLYFGSETGVTALHRDNGEVVWNHLIEKGAGAGVPIPVGDRVYVSGYDGRAYALDRSNGQIVWQHDFAKDAPADQPGFDGERARFADTIARPGGSACDGELFFQSVFDQSRLVALDCATGRRRWSFQATGWIGPAPTIADDRVYISSQDKHLYCLDRQTGQVIWKYAAPTWLASRVAVHGGKVFLPIHRGRLHQIDAQSGKLIQAFEPPEVSDRKGLVYSFPIVTNRGAYFATGEGQIYAIDVQTSRVQWKLRPSEDSELFTDLATDGRRIFAASRQTSEDSGECAIIAIGPAEES